MTQPDDNTVSPAGHRLHPAVRKVWLAGAAIAGAVFTLIGLIGEGIARSKTSVPLPWGVGALGAGLLIGGWSAVYSILRYRSWRYMLRELDLVIESGVWWKLRRCIPRSRIQHVDITSGPLDRAVGLVEVHLFTAGGIGAVAEIPGLSPEAAEHLRAQLVRSSSDGV